MRDLTVGIDSHLDDGVYTAFLLCELIGPAATYRFTDAPIAINYDGHAWANVWFTIGDMTQDGDGEVSTQVSFEDASETIRALALANDMNRFEIKVYEVWADSNATIFGDDLILHGSCDGVKSEEDATPMATIAVRGVNAANANGIGPTRDYTRLCGYHNFKDLEECQYAGVATTCDRQYTTCQSYGNQHRFGGFRYALDEGQTVTWGLSTGSQRTAARPVPKYEPPEPAGGGTSVVTPILGRRRSAGS